MPAHRSRLVARVSCELSDRVLCVHIAVEGRVACHPMPPEPESGVGNAIIRLTVKAGTSFPGHAPVRPGFGLRVSQNERAPQRHSAACTANRVLITAFWEATVQSWALLRQAATRDIMRDSIIGLTTRMSGRSWRAWLKETFVGGSQKCDGSDGRRRKKQW